MLNPQTRLPCFDGVCVFVMASFASVKLQSSQAVKPKLGAYFVFSTKSYFSEDFIKEAEHENVKNRRRRLDSSRKRPRAIQNKLGATRSKSDEENERKGEPHVFSLVLCIAIFTSEGCFTF